MKERLNLFRMVVVSLACLLLASSAFAQAPTLQIDKTSLNNGGVIKVTGKAPAGEPVFLEVWAADKVVRANMFDNKKDKETGVIPYIFYLTNEMPAYYKIFVPVDQADKIAELKKEGKKWSYSKAIKELGAEAAYNVPAKMKTERYKATLMASVIGSRGKLLEPMDDKENKKRSMQLIKSRFRSIDKVLSADVTVAADGAFSADIKIREGLAPGKYNIVAVTGSKQKSAPAVFENKISFPVLYLKTAGTSMNLLWPFLLTLVIAIFGVMM
ncbi:MAG: sulfite exporter TauE/SafE family protein, partial [Desulfobulbus sp.]